MLAPVGRVLRQPSVRMPLLVAGVVALLGGIIRAFANGFERDTWIALLIGAAILGVLLLAHLAQGTPAWLSLARRRRATGLRGRLAGLTDKPLVQGVFALVVLGIFVAGAVTAWRSSSGGSVTTASVSRQERREAAREEARLAAASGDLEGRGTAVTGDTLRVGRDDGATYRHRGAGARSNVHRRRRPRMVVRPRRASGAEWAIAHGPRGLRRFRAAPSGQAAATAKLAMSTSRPSSCAAVTCSQPADYLPPMAASKTRRAPTRLAFGVGQATRPSDYRAQKWEEAKREAPDGCPIKGSVRGGRRFYIVPWARGYERVRVSQSRGERWFCSRIRSAGSRLQAVRAILSQASRKRKARAPGEERGLRCVTPLRGDRWEGATFGQS